MRVFKKSQGHLKVWMIRWAKSVLSFLLKMFWITKLYHWVSMYFSISTPIFQTKPIINHKAMNLYFMLNFWIFPNYYNKCHRHWPFFRIFPRGWFWHESNLPCTFVAKYVRTLHKWLCCWFKFDVDNLTRGDNGP